MSGCERALPRVVACMPAWNSEKFIEETLQSLAAQTYGNLELLISDDASSDRTASICQEFARTHERVRYIRQPRRLGWIGNVNSLLRVAQGDYLFFAFHDDPLRPSYVERLVDALERHPDAVLAFADVEAHGTRRAFTALDGVRDRAERARRMLSGQGDWWVPNRGLFRAAAALQLRGMRRHIAGEFAADWPWLLRLTLLGEFVRVPEPLVTKVWLKEGLTRVWRHSRWQKFGVSLACAAVIRKAGFPLSEELELYSHLVVPPAKRLWWRLHGRVKDLSRLTNP
jgi:glycosyltransferase involved in cell wall biosynthesis